MYPGVALSLTLAWTHQPRGDWLWLNVAIAPFPAFDIALLSWTLEFSVRDRDVSTSGSQILQVVSLQYQLEVTRTSIIRSGYGRAT